MGDANSRTVIQSGGDTTLKGAQVKGRGVALSAENLNIESVQDSAAYNDRRFQGSAQITVGYGFSGSAGYSQSKTNADHRSISEQSGIYAGDGGFQVNIKGHTDLKGGIITATEAAEQNGRNRFQTATLSRSDIENHSRYQGGSFGIGMSGNADGGRDGRQQDGLNKGIGFGRDGGSRNSTTRSGIGTRNITIGNDPDGTQAKAAYTDTRTETAEANTGRLNNMFDKDRVRKELDRQREVTQQFGGSVQQVRTEINRKAEGYRKLAKIAEEEAAARLQNGDTAGWRRAVGSADENRRKAGQWQKGGVALSALASGLAAPADSGSGIAAAALNPAGAYAIGQYFKGLAQENLLGGKTETAELTAAQETARAVAHGVIAAATAAAGGSNALSAAISAGGAEAAAPYVSQWLYGEKDGSKLTAGQKETVSAVLSLGGAAVGAASGNGTDAVAGSRAAQTAVENNAFRGLEALAGEAKGMASMAGATSLYEAQMKSGKTQEEARKAVESYLKGYGLQQHTGAETLVYGSMAAPVVMIGGKAYIVAATSSVAQGVATTIVLEGTPYKVSDLVYDTTLGVFFGKALDKASGNMLKWSGENNKFLKRSLDVKSRFIQYSVGKAGSGSISKYLKDNDIILIEIPEALKSKGKNKNDKI
ncbi:hemagglutinin repeat-containing protein [Neisseria sp.]|uniref:hemagglutinin repeat-containing protein n=1 Tax=Neisseria sp. TaxID=192066 RepID=UPI0026DADFD9|nr:hemagglutinin repeat-containing protein [Neisseria sp.]MDO4907522.1 hemagglutinin repeat-containing protein [Neisseria sp.]